MRVEQSVARRYAVREFTTPELVRWRREPLGMRQPASNAPQYDKWDYGGRDD